MQAPEIRIIGSVEAKAKPSQISDYKKSLSPWKRNAVPEQESPLHTKSPSQQENKRDISLEDILSEEDHKRLRVGGKVKHLPYPTKQDKGS